MLELEKITIRTPEGVQFSMPLAGPVSRFMAFVVDLSIILLVMQMINYLSTMLNIFSADFAEAFYIVIYFLVTFGYGIILEWYWSGQTIGKRLFRLRVIDRFGKKLQFGQVFLRNIFRIVDSLPFLYLLGGLVVLFGSHYRRLGDIVGNTIVTRTSSESFQLSRLSPVDKYNSLRHLPGFVTVLRQKITPSEADLIYQALLRRDSLLPEIRADLMEEIAAYLKSRINIPEEVYESISDERLLRNIIDVLFPAENIS